MHPGRPNPLFILIPMVAFSAARTAAPAERGFGSTIPLHACLEGSAESDGLECTIPDDPHLWPEGFTAPRPRFGKLPAVRRSEIRFQVTDRLTVEVVVDASGRTISAKLARPSDFFPTYDPRVVEAVKTWRWYPVLRDGKPLEAKFWMEVAIRVSSDAVPDAPSNNGDLAAVCARLRGLPVTDASASGVVPPQAMPWLRELKTELGSAVARAFDGLPLDGSIAEVVERRIVRGLAGRGVTVGEEPGDNELGWGYVLAVRARRAEANPNLVAVTTTISVPCGSDAALFLFRRDGVAWTRVLVEEAREYDDISGAREQTAFVIGSEAQDGSFLVLTTDVPAWCSSIWHPLRYRVRRVVPGRAEPLELLREETEAIATGAGYDVRAEHDGFTIFIKAWDDENPGVPAPERIRLREIQGKIVERRSRITSPESHR